MIIKQESIAKLKELADIVDIVREYLPKLKKSGKNYFANCPFHSERTPSFSVAADKKIVHCFGCGYSADIFKFIQDIEHVSYIEAVEKLAKRLNFKLEYIKVDKETITQRDISYKVIAEIAELYHSFLLKEKFAAEARNYLSKRGVLLETIKNFKIGYAPQDNFLTRNFKKYDLSTLFNAGVINFFLPEGEKDESKKYDNPYDYFRDRIIFPVFDVSGKVVSFGGRVVPGSITATKDNIPVYLNGPDTNIFNKGSTLYGLFQAKQQIAKKNVVIIVEGYMDVVVLHQEGFSNTVAPLGTSLTSGQIKTLSRFTENVLVMFDPDNAGQNAAISACQLIYKNGMYPQIVNLSDKKDPDEFVLVNGSEKLSDELAKSKNPVKYLVEYLTASANKTSINSLDLREKISILKKLVEMINNITHPLLKEEAIKEAAEELQIKEDIIRSELKRFNLKLDGLQIEKVLDERPYSCEEEILWLCIHYPDIVQQVPEEVFDHHEGYYDIFKKIKQMYSNSRDITEVIDSIETPLKEVIIKIVFDNRDLKDSIEKRVSKLFQDISRIKYIKRYKELKPVITEMLEQKNEVNIELYNEYKQLLEILKK